MNTCHITVLNLTLILFILTHSLMDCKVKEEDTVTAIINLVWQQSHTHKFLLMMLPFDSTDLKSDLLLNHLYNTPFYHNPFVYVFGFLQTYSYRMTLAQWIYWAKHAFIRRSCEYEGGRPWPVPIRAIVLFFLFMLFRDISEQLWADHSGNQSLDSITSHTDSLGAKCGAGWHLYFCSFEADFLIIHPTFCAFVHIVEQTWCGFLSDDTKQARIL